MIERAAAAARLGIKAHAHMLRHACGYKLANDGIDTRSLQAYLGPRNIANTVRYTGTATGSTQRSARRANVERLSRRRSCVGRLTAVGTMRCDHLNASVSQLFIQRIAVIGAIADQILRLGFDHVEVEA